MSLALAAFLASFFGMLVFGVPVAWSMLLSAIAWMALSGNWHALPLVPERIYQGMDVFVLMAVPMFVLAGDIINAGRITERLIHFANLVFGWLRGGLAQVNIGASILFSGVTGVALGDIATLGRVLIPSMVAQGFSPAYAAAVTASSSIIGPMVPPSLIVVLYGSMTNDSIGALFAACLFPGLLIGALQMLLVSYQARRRGWQPIPADRSPRSLARGTAGAAVPLMIPVIIMAGILGGVLTPTEAGAAAAFYALVVTLLIYRTLNVRQLGSVFSGSMRFTGHLFIIVGCGAVFSWVLAIENVPVLLTTMIENSHLSRFETLLLFNAFLLVVGMFIDSSAAIILFAPILGIAAGAVGVDPIHFGAIVVLNLNIGLLTPPLGVCLFAAEKIAGCGLPALLRETTPFLAVNLIGLVLVTAIPEFSLWLPGILGF